MKSFENSVNTIQLYFLTKPYQILFFCKRKISQSICSIFYANNISAGGKRQLTTVRRQIHSKTEMSYAIIEEYSPEYFSLKSPKKKIRIVSFGRKNILIQTDCN